MSPDITKDSGGKGVDEAASESGSNNFSGSNPRLILFDKWEAQWKEKQELRQKQQFEKQKEKKQRKLASSEDQGDGVDDRKEVL